MGKLHHEVCRGNRGSAIQYERVGKYQPYPVRPFHRGTIITIIITIHGTIKKNIFYVQTNGWKPIKTYF